MIFAAVGTAAFFFCGHAAQMVWVLRQPRMRRSRTAPAALDDWPGSDGDCGL